MKNVFDIYNPLGSRINICGGGGKTTLSRAISEKYGHKHIELDSLYWNPGWQPESDRDFKAKTALEIGDADHSWVVDGNYTSKLNDLVLTQCDLVIWLNLPWKVVFWRIVLRCIKRARTKARICGDNFETWKQMFSKDSLLLYLIQERKQYINRKDLFLPLISKDVPVLEISSTKQLREFYKFHGL